eukprot:CAMPEP_0168304010 /NCGR_PEP_ID=MMETSP0142_2-20121227/45090_1 /TAXON_ID=44445 /ORGANISM="Pseudo-nitzschia australis, Strain 10249 10 AB" /LENGTH=279 /DNA_ID=CAMNT_0008255085 /DNA_START=154 /DNA_END=993 /DNA_ORIENTATION=-
MMSLRHINFGVRGSESPPSGRSLTRSASSFYKPDPSKESDVENSSSAVHSTSTSPSQHSSKTMQKQKKSFRRRRGQGLTKNASSSSLSSSQHTHTSNTQTQQQHPPIVGKTKTVNFEKIARVKRIKPRYQYSEQQHRDMWYSQSEYVEIKQRVLVTIKKMKGEKSRSKLFTDDDEQTARGLESRTRSASKERREFKITACRFVLDEQEHQDDLGINNPNRLRKKYLTASVVASSKALEVGRKDAETAAKDISLKEVLRVLRREHSSCPQLDEARQSLAL